MWSKFIHRSPAIIVGIAAMAYPGRDLRISSFWTPTRECAWDVGEQAFIRLDVVMTRDRWSATSRSNSLASVSPNGEPGTRGPSADVAAVRRSA